MSEGERVRLGQQIAAVGDSGDSLVPHLHLHVQDSPDFGEQAPYRSDRLPQRRPHQGRKRVDARGGGPKARRPHPPDRGLTSCPNTRNVCPTRKGPGSCRSRLGRVAHALILLTSLYHSAGNRLIVVPLFAGTIVAGGFAFGYLRLWTGSVWAAATRTLRTTPPRALGEGQNTS